MNRPAGVIASAIICFIGSAFTLLMALMFAVVMSTPQAIADPQVTEMRGAIYLLIVLMGVAAGLGIATGVGLLRMRGWARMSAMVFGGLLTFFCGLGLLAVALIPFDQLAARPSVMRPGIMRTVLMTTYAVPFAIGVWWLVMFNRRGVKSAFEGDADAVPPRRPWTISIIGWFNIVGGVLVLMTAISGMPAAVLGHVVTGWGATLFYVFTGGVHTYLGWHLLKLDPHARILTIWWFVITILHAAYMAFMPGAMERMREFQLTYMAEQGAEPPPFDMTMFTVIVMVVTMVVLAAAIWPLVKHKAAFESVNAPEDRP